MLTEEEKRKRVADWTRKYYYNRWSSPDERKQYERERKRAYRKRIWTEHPEMYEEYKQHERERRRAYRARKKEGPPNPL